MKKLLFVFIVLYSMSISQLHAAIEKSYEFSLLKLRIDTILVNGNIRVDIQYDDFSRDMIGDSIFIPTKTVYFSVPYNATDFKVSLTESNCQVLPVPSPINMREKSSTDSTDIEDNPIVISSVGYVDGIHKILKIKLQPIVIGEDGESVSFYSKIGVKIDWEYNDHSLDSPQIIFCQQTEFDSYTENVLEGVVENPMSISLNTPMLFTPLTVDCDLWEYIIITPSRFCDVMERLAAMRRNKGYRTKVISIESILGNEEFSDGDIISGINDEAGKLRAFITNAYSEHGTRYILLAGQYPEIPIRYGRMDLSFNNECNESTWIPTDLYFSDLNACWDADEDGKYAENGDRIDFFTEVHVGRIPFTSVEDVNNYIDKLKIYEYNPGKGDLSYLNKAFVSRQYKGLVTFPHTNYKKEEYYTDADLMNLHEMYGDNLVKKFDTLDVHPTGKDVISLLKETPCVHQNFIGHGNPGGVAVSTLRLNEYYGIYATKGINAYHILETENSLEEMQNEKYPTWNFSTSCSLMPFDEYKGYEYLPRTFGKSYILGKKYGGVALFGNTRDSRISEGSKQTRYFYKYLKRLRDNGAIKPLYAAEIMDYLRGFAPIEMNETLMHNLYGDPLVPLWIGVPDVLSYKAVNGIETCNYEIYGVEDSVIIAKQSLFEPTYASRQHIKLSNGSLVNIQPNEIRTIYSRNQLPLILPLYICDYEFEAGVTRHIFAENVYCSFYDYTERTGYVRFGENSDVTIEASGYIEVYSGVELKSGAKVTLNADVDVFITSLQLADNAKLTINAPKIYLFEDIRELYPNAEIVFNGELYVNGELCSDEGPTLIKRRVNREYKPLVVEGRTWWYVATGCGPVDIDYSYYLPDYDRDYNFGISIGQTVEIYGKVWHTVKLIRDKFVDYRNNVRVDSTSHLVGFIREENKRVYILYCMNDSGEKPVLDINRMLSAHAYSLMDNGEMRCPHEKLIYDMNGVGTVMQYGFKEINGIPSWYPATIIEENVFENSGYTYVKYKTEELDLDQWSSPLQHVFVEGIGEVDDVAPCGMFFMPYGFWPYNSRPVSTSPQLRYVTEGVDNHVIYTALGGEKIWLESADISNVEASVDKNTPRYYNLQGIEVNRPLQEDIYIEKMGNRARKVMFGR